MIINPSASNFLEAAMEIAYSDSIEVFWNTFGVHPEVCVDVCKRITNFPNGTAEKHLLWALLFLRGETFTHLEVRVNASNKTVRYWVWRMIFCIGGSAHFSAPRNIISHRFKGPIYGYDDEFNNKSLCPKWRVLVDERTFDHPMVFQSIFLFEIMDMYYIAQNTY